VRGFDTTDPYQTRRLRLLQIVRAGNRCAVRNAERIIARDADTGSCGSNLGTLCPKCGAANEADENFCGDCGAAIFGPEPKVNSVPPKNNRFRLEESIPVAEAVEGERKTVTALFADIKGSTELMEDLDPEQARDIIDPALKLMMAGCNVTVVT
jgi:Double zinc ribbon